MAEVFEARGIVSGAYENEYCKRESGGLQAAARANPELPWPPTTAELRSAWTGEGARPHTRHLIPSKRNPGFHLSPLPPREPERAPVWLLQPGRRRRSARVRRWCRRP